MTDYDQLVSDARDWEGALESPTARDVVRRLADAVEALRAENRRCYTIQESHTQEILGLRAERDEMTVEHRGRMLSLAFTGAGWTPVDTRTAQYILTQPERYPDFEIEQRRVGSWAVVGGANGKG